MAKVAVIGTGAWGTALAIMSAKLDHETTLVARNSQTADLLRERRQNAQYLSGAVFPEALTVESDGRDAIHSSDCAIIAVPSVHMRETVERHADSFRDSSVVVSATKGLEIRTGKRMSEVIDDVLMSRLDKRVHKVCSLSGPNLAPEITRGLPALATAASEDISVAEFVQRMLSGRNYRIYASADIIGVELGGTLKNVIAIGAGFIDAADLGANAKAAYVTRGMYEITKLGVAMGAQASTFAGLSGIGDALATCFSSLSRNYRLGAMLATGTSLERALETLGQTAEGVPTTRATFELARRLNVEMPITRAAHKVLFEGVNPVDAISALMERELQHEV